MTQRARSVLFGALAIGLAVLLLLRLYAPDTTSLSSEGVSGSSAPRPNEAPGRTRPKAEVLLEASPPVASRTEIDVVSVTGEPVADVEVEFVASRADGKTTGPAILACTSTGIPIGRTETGGSLTWVWGQSGAADKKWRFPGCVVTRHPSFIPKSVVVADTPPTHLVIRLQRGIQLRGRIISESGSPIPGANVEFRQGGSLTMPGGATAQSHADADGRFVLTGVAASHAGVITAKASGFSSSSKYLDLPLQSELVIGLEQQFEFRVRLKGIGGSPIPGGVVCIGGGSAVSYDLIRGEAHSAFRTLAAEPDGAHLLVGMPQGRYWCFAAATGHAPRAELVLVSRQTAPHEITLESASGRSGTVRDAETLAPVSGARVQVLPKWSDWDLPGITAVKDALAGGCASITDDSGTFWAPCLDETVGVLHCDADGYSPERLQVLEIATSGSIDLRLRPLHRKDVPVLIQSIAGHPISDAVVIASGGVRSADSGGRCVLPAVSTIEPIQVLAPGYISRAVFPSHDATSYPQLIVLARAGPPVCGQVVDRAGAPLPGVVVQCEGIDGEQVLPIGYYDRYQVTDEKGMVAFVQPIAPQYRVFVAPTRGSGEVRTTASESFVLIADVIEHSRIRGSVVLLGGRSIPPGLRVSATRDDPGARRVTQDADVRRDGSFEIADLAPGTWAVRASGVTARNRIQPVSEVKRVVTSRGDVEVRLELREELLLGLVRDE